MSLQWSPITMPFLLHVDTQYLMCTTSHLLSKGKPSFWSWIWCTSIINYLSTQTTSPNCSNITIQIVRITTHVLWPQKSSTNLSALYGPGAQGSLNCTRIHLWCFDCHFHNSKTFGTPLRCLQCLTNNNIVVNLNTCTFGVKEFDSFGHSIGHRGITLLASKVQPIREFPQLETESHLQVS